MMKVEVKPEDDMSQMQRDLLDRITCRFNLWSRDGAALYHMGGLHESTFARDRFILLVGAIAIEIADRDIPIADVARALMDFVQQLKDEDK